MTVDFISHLEELRKRLLISIGIFFTASAGCYFFSSNIVDALIVPLNRYENTQLVFQTPYEAFMAHLHVSALAGFVLSSPVIFAQIWGFLTPGLYSSEKKIILPLAFFSGGLFAIGCAFAYFVVIPMGLQFFLSFQTENLKPLISIAPYFSFFLWMMAGCGFVFVFPLVLLGLIRLGVLPLELLMKVRKYVVVAVFFLAAVMTPPDPISQILVALPLWFLFEICLLIGTRIESKKARKPNKDKA